MTLDPERRPLIALLASHWLCALGAALVTSSVFSWLVLPLHLRGRSDNAYIGLLAFIAIPAVFFVGLALIPIGLGLAKRRLVAGLATVHDKHTVYRRIAWFFGVMTVLNILLASQFTYKAVAHMETVQFCGQTCHVMKPQFTANQLGPHQNVLCVECHVSPGASGWLKSKMAGTRQLVEVVFNTYPRPIPSAVETNRLVSSAGTCEQCHSRANVAAPRLRVIPKFADDEANTPSHTVLTMFPARIHAAHMGHGVTVRYRAADARRQTIPWVEYSNAARHIARTYAAPGASASNLPEYEMQCVDCHNMPAHSFELPEQAMDRALADGSISSALPFIRKNGVQILKASYATDEEAAQKIPAAVKALYERRDSAVNIPGAANALLNIYRRNVFPDLKVTWGTYPNQLGHIDSPGCFRCHDEGHTADDRKTLTQDCSACHTVIAVEEPAPEILKTTGIASP